MDWKGIPLAFCFATWRGGKQNTILKYSMKEEVLYGNVKSYDIESLMNIVMINLDGRKNLSSTDDEKSTLVGLLNTIFTSDLDGEQKLKN